MTALENEILEIINEVTGHCYIGKLTVIEESDGYTLRLGLNTPNAPTVLYYQGSVEDFKKYIKEEIKRRRYPEIEYWNTLKEPFNI
jgi:hypothetical protein